MSSAQAITVEQIASRFQDAESPMDFIKKNLAAKQAKAEAIPPTTPYQPETFPEDPYEIPEVLDTTTKTESPVDEAEKAGEAKVEANAENSPEVPEGEAPVKKKSNKEENLGNLRKIVEATKAEKEAIAAEKLQLQQELENVKAGFVPNEKLEEKEEKIKELEKYQQMVDFENSREYREKFQTKLDSLKSKAQTIAQEYNVDPRVLDQALRMNNKADRNKYLKHHFGDEVGAYEARLVLEELQGTYQEAHQAKQEPLKALERLRAESIEREAKDQEARIDNLIRASRDSWKESLKEVEDLERYPELNFKPNDPEHNKIVAPIIEEAAREYGKFIKLLGAMGIKELPKEVQKMLAKTFTTSRAYGVANESRNQYSKLLEEVQSSSGRRAAIVRPGVGGSMGGNQPTQYTGSGPKPSLDQKIEGLLSKTIKS